MPHLYLSAIPVGSTGDNLLFLVEKAQLEILSPVLQPAEMAFLRAAAAKGVTSFFFPQASHAVLVQLLDAAADTPARLEEARLNGNSMLRELRHYKITTLALRSFCSDALALAFLEGLMLGNYQFLRYFSQPEKKDKSLTRLEWMHDQAPEAAIAELNAVVQAVFLARDLVNEPHSHLNALKLADAARAAGRAAGFDVEVLGKEQIESLRMGGLLAVNQASEVPPQFCILEWRPTDARNAQPIILVGKGVVYDTGGLSLKPTESMDYMKCDMAGAAAVIGVLSAAARTRLPLHVIGLIPATDNKIGEHALSPGDVIRMYSGKTVEVVNTDAEGRLILADALHYAKKYAPEVVLDLATLTGAAVRALGTQGICYMGTAPAAVKQALEASGWQTYERLVELPLWKEYGEELKSAVADLKNVGSVNAGVITAGKFLEHFADYPWLHLDIAGPAYLRHANGYRTREGTGVGVRLLFDFLKRRSAQLND